MYKLVRKIDDKLYSAWADSNLCRPNILEYKLDEWTYPKIGKIFVFDSHTSAASFIDSHFRYCSWIVELYKCEIIGEPESIRTIANDIFREDYEIFWAKNKEVTTMAAPAGTLVVDAVKLVEEVKYYV